MTRAFTGLLAGAALALSGLGAAAAIAQPAPPPGAERHHFDPQAHAQKLKDLLQLRPSQEGALAAFVAAMTPPPRPDMDEDRTRPATTPERLARMEEMMGKREAAMRRRIEATRAFYGQLDPAQRKAFDAMPMMGRKGGHGGHDGKGMRHGGPDGMRGPDGPPPPQ